MPKDEGRAIKKCTCIFSNRWRCGFEWPGRNPHSHSEQRYAAAVFVKVIVGLSVVAPRGAEGVAGLFASAVSAEAGQCCCLLPTTRRSGGARAARVVWSNVCFCSDPWVTILIWTLHYSLCDAVPVSRKSQKPHALG